MSDACKWGTRPRTVACARDTEQPSLETPHPTLVGALWSTQPVRARPCMHARMHARCSSQQKRRPTPSPGFPKGASCAPFAAESIGGAHAAGGGPQERNAKLNRRAANPPGSFSPRSPLGASIRATDPVAELGSCGAVATSPAAEWAQNRRGAEGTCTEGATYRRGARGRGRGACRSSGAACDVAPSADGICLSGRVMKTLKGRPEGSL